MQEKELKNLIRKWSQKKRKENPKRKKNDFFKWGQIEKTKNI
jgi:hypothetical protein